MTSDAAVPARPASEDPQADWTEHEFTCWSPRDEPWLCWSTIAVGGAVVAASWSVSRRLWVVWCVLGGLMLTGWRIWLPTSYRLGPLGLRHRVFRRWILIPWSRIQLVETRPRGVVFATDALDSPPLPTQVFYVHGGKRASQLKQLVARFIVPRGLESSTLTTT